MVSCKNEPNAAVDREYKNTVTQGHGDTDKRPAFMEPEPFGKLTRFEGLQKEVYRLPAFFPQGTGERREFLIKIFGKFNVHFGSAR